MDNERAYLEQCYPERVIVLGQRLEPFSLGHLKILLSQQNKFITGGIPTFADLIFGVWVCCQTYQEAMTGMEDPRMERKLVKWGRRVKKANFADAVGVFSRYIQRSCKGPDTDKSGKGRAPGSPAVQRVQLILLGELGHTLDQAMNKPWGEALWDVCAWSEMRGGTKIFGSDEEQMFELADRMRKEMQN